MSSILDALERASQERQPGKEHILPQTQLPAKRGSMPILLLSIVLVLLLILVTLWLLLRAGDGGEAPPAQNRRVQIPADGPRSTSTQPGGAETAQADQPAVKGNRLTAERIRSSSRPNQQPLVSEAVLSEKPQRRNEQIPPKRPVAPARPAQRRAAVPVDRSPSVPRPAEPKPPPAVAIARPPGVSINPEQADASVKADSAMPDAVEPAVADESENETAVAPEIPLIWELEQGLREKLEQLKTTIHVYNEAPSQRFVIINMRRYSEGDTLGASGYRLHEINRDGIIVDYGSGLVRLLRDKY
ncbi:MAG: general secretion pathway protein GspB [Candidatus Thiodiazotropha sp.]|nr:general secretion pathway protein GspB [Candidatus Thiodiazotropha sp. (ex Lucina pensylvanica)]